MATQNKIAKIQQQIAKDERNLALEKIKQRKADTRKKIELGGLVIKAKMHEYSKAVILGALIEVEFHLRCDEDLKRLYQMTGTNRFFEKNNIIKAK
ncbi:MAG: conjugal transfer protein TraD [Legionellales bacterium]|nr:conjugal transfer protein TraD [Legionellales bacterium]|tara:strand:+ start:425 stop:712 length:288 start_codon:yes stop_codon:yes gene_type:complete